MSRPAADIMNRLALSATCSPKSSFEDLLRLAVQTGIRAVETFTTWTGSRLGPDVIPADAARAALAQYGIDMRTMNCVNLSDPEALERLGREMDYAAAIGVKAVNVKGGGRDQNLDDFLALAREAVTMARARGLLLNLGNHPGNRIEGVRDYDRVIGSLGPLAPHILLDAGHFLTVGESPIPVVRHWSERIGLVHLNDRRAGKGVALGCGELDCPALFAALREAGYVGDLVLELEGETEGAEATEAAAEVAAAVNLVLRFL